MLCTIKPIRPRQGHLRAKPAHGGRNLDRIGALPMFFEENRGQERSNARFISRSSLYDVALYPDRVEVRPAARGGKPGRDGRPLALRFAGASENATVQGEDQLPAKGNYFIGNDPSAWQLNIGAWQKVRYAGVYPGVDVVYYGKQHELEYDLVIASGTSPGIISWRLDGARDIRLSASGELTAALSDGQQIVQRTPLAYQEIDGARRPVTSRYAFRADGNIGVELGSYDARYPVVVDPVLSYSTYIGDAMEDRANGVAVDANGNVYVVGEATFASSAPGTFGANRDVFLWKFDPTGTTLLYYALFGGTYNENGNAIAVDNAGNAYIAGTTSSSDLPTTANAYSMNPIKTPDAFLAKFDTTQPAGSSLIFSTHFAADDARGIAVDAAGKVYLTGQASWNFVTTPGAFQRTCSTCSYTKDAYVSKFDLSRSGTATLVYSTYLGGTSVPLLGSADDIGYAIAVDAQGQATVVGSASSLDFPLRNAVQTSYQGGTVDAFVTRLNATGSGLIYSTFLGTSETDWATAIALDSAGNAYVTGLTNWNGFPVTPGAFQPAWNLNQCGTISYFAPCADAFVTKLDNSGQLVYSTYLGGSLRDYGYGIAVDGAGSAYVTGYALSFDFPTVNAIAGAGTGANDAFVVKLNPQGTGLLFSSYLGGTDDDEGLAIAAFNGDVFVAGKTDSTDLPVLNAVQAKSAGSTDGFLLKISGLSAPAASLSSIAVNPSNVPGGVSSAGTIMLSSAAPSGGATVTLTSSNTIAATVPPTAVVPAGATSVSFVVTSKSVTTATPVTISGSYGGVVKTAVLTVSPAATLSGITVSPTTVVGPAPATGTITLSSAAPPGGATVTLTSSNTGAATAPAAATVPAGATSVSFLVSTKTVAMASPVTISGSYGGVAKTAVLTVSPVATPVPTGGLRFIPITPCRVADTRKTAGPFGGPAISAGATRSFTIAGSACGIPSGAEAYSFNVAVVPAGPLGYLTLWPTGQTQPGVATLNSVDGRIKSVAAIIPAGTAGAVSVYATNRADVILDINGYFVSASNTSALAFYPLPPCRIADTRKPDGPLAGPALAGGKSRTFGILSSTCSIPNTAQAYSLNLATIPRGPVGFVTAYPTGQIQPAVASLNDVMGRGVANAAIVPAGTSGSLDIFASNDTDLVIDIDGYFAPPLPGGLSLYNVTPCRAYDSRTPSGTPPFSGQKNVPIGGSCNAPLSAQAFVLGATVVPSGALGYLTLWAQGQTQPGVATLNALDGVITSNLALVPTINGSISAFASNSTSVILDLFGYFAP